MNYLSKVILTLKEKFPKHCAWKEPGFITRMRREEFGKKCKSEKGRGNVDVYKDTKTGIYS